MTATRKAFVNKTRITLLGKAPGALFKLEVNDDGKPRDSFWRRRFDASEIEAAPVPVAEVHDKPAQKRAKPD